MDNYKQWVYAKREIGRLNDSIALVECSTKKTCSQKYFTIDGLKRKQAELKETVKYIEGNTPTYCD